LVVVLFYLVFMLFVSFFLFFPFPFVFIFHFLVFVSFLFCWILSFSNYKPFEFEHFQSWLFFRNLNILKQNIFNYELLKNWTFSNYSLRSELLCMWIFLNLNIFKIWFFSKMWTLSNPNIFWNLYISSNLNSFQFCFLFEIWKYAFQSERAKRKKPNVIRVEERLLQWWAARPIEFWFKFFSKFEHFLIRT
jgi:hypothetical protein